MRAAMIFRVAAIALAACAFVCAAPAGAVSRPGDAVPGEVLVALRSTGPRIETVRQLAFPIGTITHAITPLRVYRLKLRPGLTAEYALREIRNRPDVLYAEQVHRVAHLATPDDPLFASQQYGLQITHANDSWDIWRPKKLIVIAVIDTGIDLNHPDLAEVIYRDLNGDPISYNSQTGTSDAFDDHGHGTHCAGIAAAHTNNGTGIAGAAGFSTAVPDASQYIRLMPVKAIDGNGNGTDADLAAGIVWAADHGARVISVSVGSAAQSTTLDNAVKYARDNGAVVVASAGNGAASYPLYPAACEGVISVAATDASDSLTDFTQYGSWVRTAAPGKAITSTQLGGQYGAQSGTSMSAPLVAGEAAAIMAQNPLLSSNDVANIIVRHVDAYTPYSGRSLNREAGRVNVQRAIQAAGYGELYLTSITVNPSTISNGESATGTVYLGRPAPFDVWIQLQSSNSAVAAVPTGIYVPAGSSSAAFDVLGVSGSATALATIMASGMGPSVSTSVIVRAPKISAFTLSPTTVTGGVKVTGTITLDGPAPPGGTAVDVTFSSTAASTASPVIIPAGQTSTTFQVNTFPVATTTTVQVTAASGGTSLQASFTIKRPVIISVGLNPSSLVGGSTSIGTITLTGAAPTGGIAIKVTSSSASAQVPASVVVPSGQASADFTITTSSVTANVSATIKGVTGAISATATLTIKPLLSTITIAPATVTGGQSSVGTIKLNAPAGSAIDVRVASANPATATAPDKVTIPQGASSADFTIRTAPVSASTTVGFSATWAGVTKSANLTVKPPALSTLTMSPSTVVGGSNSTGTITLTGSAPAGGITVVVETSDGVVQAPATVFVPEGTSVESFGVTTGGVGAAKTFTVSASYAGVKKSAYLTVKAPSFKSFVISPATVRSGVQATATVEITGPAPAGGLSVMITSNNAAAIVPATVVIPGGATTVSFLIDTGPVSANTTATIKATTLNVTKSATLTITP